MAISVGGNKLLAKPAPYVGARATLLPLDAALGVNGLPQSATGQAVLLTGINIPQEIGEHYGPKPNPAVAKYLLNGNLFSQVIKAGKTAALLNAYPPRYFDGVDSGKRLYSAIPLAVTSAGLSLFDKDDYYAGRALSADFIGDGWRGMLGFPDAPTYQPREAGNKLAELANQYDFSFFEAIEQFKKFDDVLSGLCDQWDDQDGLILVTSDHGNMEDLSTRRHTDAKVPGLLIGSSEARAAFASELNDLTGIYRRILKAISP